MRFEQDIIATIRQAFALYTYHIEDNFKYPYQFDLNGVL